MEKPNNPYIGILLINAKEMDNENYLIQSKLGNIIIDKNTFHNIFFPINNCDRITENDLVNFIKLGKLSVTKIRNKTLMVEAELPTGFVEYETSSRVEKSSALATDNYSDKIGKELALKRIQSKLWDRFGFILQWAKYGLTRK